MIYTVSFDSLFYFDDFLRLANRLDTKDLSIATVLQRTFRYDN